MRSRAKSDPQYPLGDVLDFLRQWWALNHALERASKRMQARIGITAQQRLVVRILGQYPGMAPGQLARILHLDPGSISATVRRLEEAGLVERRRASSDGRGVALVLTARGKRVDARDPQTIEGALERLLGSVPRRDVEAVRSFLSAFVSEIEGTAAPAARAARASTRADERDHRRALSSPARGPRRRRTRSRRLATP